MSQTPSSPPTPPLNYMPPRESSVFEAEARTFAMLCHLSGLSGAIIPFGNIIGPLVFWLIKKDRYPFVDQQGREALNFNISYVIYSMVAAMLMLVFIGFILLPVVVVAWLVLLVIASVRAKSGEAYRYPLIIRFL